MPGRFTHHLELYSTADIDDQVRAWLKETMAGQVDSGCLWGRGKKLAKFDAQKHWWMVVTAAAAVGVAAIVITDRWMPANQEIGGFILLGLIGISFYWAYSTNREGFSGCKISRLGIRFSMMSSSSKARRSISSDGYSPT